jgi:hypothetical protein
LTDRGGQGRIALDVTHCAVIDVEHLHAVADRGIERVGIGDEPMSGGPSERLWRRGHIVGAR